jgi:hypothetical protein
MRYTTATLLAVFLAGSAFGQAANNHTFNTYEGDPLLSGGSDVLTSTNPQQINGAGATLFVDFFRGSASTNDFIDPDDDDIFTGASAIDQLAPSVPLSSSINWNDGPTTNAEDQNYWLFQYRSVGSANGFQEFVNYQTTRGLTHAALPTELPSENGLLNRSEWVDQNGNVNFGAANGSSSKADLWNQPDAQNQYASFLAPLNNTDTVEVRTGTPFAPQSIDFSLADVPSLHVVRTSATTGQNWSNSPGDAGYGNNPNDSGANLRAALTAGNQGGDSFSNQLKSLGLEYNLNYYDSAAATGSGNVGDNTLKSVKVTSADLPGALTLNQKAPANDDDKTIFDTPLAFGPIGYIANHGTNIESEGGGDGEVRVTELQHAYTTGRWNTGENFNVASRDSGSGTRNAAATSLGIDPAWLRGDNDGVKASSSETDVLGPDFQVGNRGGSSRMEGTVQNSRIALGYTGLAGGSRSAKDNRDGKYELFAIMRDVDNSAGDANSVGAGTAFVLPSVDAIVNNDDANTGYAYGGLVSISTLGNPKAGWVDYDGDGVIDANPESGEWYGVDVTGAATVVLNTTQIDRDGDGTIDGTIQTSDFANHAGNPSDHGMENESARDYLRNIVASIAGFTAPGGSTPEDDFMPGQFLGTKFFQPAALNATQQDLNDPDRFTINGDQVAALKTETLSNNDFGAGGDPLAWGSGGTDGSREFGRVPDRTDLSSLGTELDNTVYDTDAGVGTVAYAYSDGSTNGDYIFKVDEAVGKDYDGNSSTGESGVLISLAGGSLGLNEANAIAGDFNQDGDRTTDDIAKMVEAAESGDTVQWAYDQYNKVGAAGTPFGSKAEGVEFDGDGLNLVSAEILGDFNGDGNFNASDVRYFADGLAMSSNTFNVATGTDGAPKGIDIYGGGADAVLDRAKGFYLVDDASSSGNFFGTTLATGKAYAKGDSRGDIAGSFVGTNKGGAPIGADGTVDAQDIDYLTANYRAAVTNNTNNDGDAVAEWLVLDEAVWWDLSADMNGDLTLDISTSNTSSDLRILVEDVLGTFFGDANLDGSVTGADLGLLDAGFGQAGGWVNGDFNGDGVVTGADLGLLDANFGLGPVTVSASEVAALEAFKAGLVPEPGTLALLGLGGLGLLRRRRR